VSFQKAPHQPPWTTLRQNHFALISYRIKDKRKRFLATIREYQALEKGKLCSILQRRAPKLKSAFHKLRTQGKRIRNNLMVCYVLWRPHLHSFLNNFA